VKRKTRAKTRMRKPRKRAIKKFKPNLTYLRAYEREIIMSDIYVLEERQPISVASLDRLTPGRYDLKQLKAALKDLHRERVLRLVSRQRVFGYGNSVDVYALRQEFQRKAA